MKFSILIAHYNNAEYFKDCYHSLLKQTYLNWEAVILDDCSNPEERKKVQELVKNDTRFKFFENSENKGVGYTKKKLIELATGDICGFVDPDDALTTNALEKSIDSYHSSKIVATYSQLYNCNKNLEIKGLFPHSRKIRNKNPLFFNIRFEVAHFFTFRKTTYDRTSKIDSSISSSVDQDLYLKLYEKGDFKYIQEPLYLYRLHEKGVSQEKNKKTKLYQNWHIVLYNCLKRRGIHLLYKKNIENIESLPEFIFNKQNSIWNKIYRKLS